MKGAEVMTWPQGPGAQVGQPRRDVVAEAVEAGEVCMMTVDEARKAFESASGAAWRAADDLRQRTEGVTKAREALADALRWETEQAAQAKVAIERRREALADWQGAEEREHRARYVRLDEALAVVGVLPTVGASR